MIRLTDFITVSLDAFVTTNLLPSNLARRISVPSTKELSENASEDTVNVSLRSISVTFEKSTRCGSGVGEGVAEGVGAASVVSSVTVVSAGAVVSSVRSLFVGSSEVSVTKALPRSDMPSPNLSVLIEQAARNVVAMPAEINRATSLFPSILIISSYLQTLFKISYS